MIIESYAKNYIEELSKLSHDRKLVIGLCNLVRFEKSVKQFDKIYNKNLSDEFKMIVNGFTNYAQGDSSHLPNRNSIESLAPDTDDYSETIGSVTQNAFGSAYYLHFYAKSKDDKFLFQSLDKSFESVDAIEYDEGNDDEEERYLKNEANTIESIFHEVKNVSMLTESNIVILLNSARKKQSPLNDVVA